ncbi:MAG: hypothetical protein ABI134_16900, partial [Byssovorax sp.]
GNAVRFHPELLALSGHLNVAARLCGVRKPNQKGKVERAIRYLRDRFFAARTIRDLDRGNADLLTFLRAIANACPHPRWPKRCVADVFVEEQSRLLALPSPLPSTDLVQPVAIDKSAYATRLTLDLEGNPLVITDARQNQAMRHLFGRGGRKLWQKSCDAGERWMLMDVGGALLRAWDERGHTKRATYDAARRATHAYVQQGTAAEQLVGRTVYGEAHPSAAALNLRGKAYQVYDGAVVVTSGAHDFKGNLLHGTRRLAADYHSVPDWSVLATLTDVAAIATAAESLVGRDQATPAAVREREADVVQESGSLTPRTLAPSSSGTQPPSFARLL